MNSATSRSSQSSLSSSVPNASTPSSLLHPQQQKQQPILYGAIVNPVIPLQPYAPAIQHPPCIYPTVQRHGGLSNPVSLPMQGKANRWQFKNKINRGQQQQYNQQQQPPQQSSYNPKPTVIFDQQGTSNNSLPPSSSTFILTSSSFAHTGFPGESYNSSGMTLLPQASYLKPSNPQTFCLLQDRQKSQLTQRQQTTAHGSYYNISTANACSLQTVNTNKFQLPNVNPYTTVTSLTSNQITGPVQTIQQATQIFPNPPIGLLFDGGGQLREKLPTCANINVSSTRYTREKLSAVATSRVTGVDSIGQTESHCDWSVEETTKASSASIFEQNHTETSLSHVPEKRTIVEKAQEECAASDESSVSFEFTLEAEKMVSALCNTTSSNDLSKEESRNAKSETTAFFDGAGDNPSNKNAWFTNLCAENESSKSIAVQTDYPCTDRSQYPELIRKTAYWGCTKAETVLDSKTSQSDIKCDRLMNLSSATRTAITKSSTCFPVFAGDRAFAKDLINALLRVSNGWLILDNYLNKQHYPSLAEKLNDELIRCFQAWEENTYELLRQIVQTFLKLEENCRVSDKEERLAETTMGSFPGDVTLYTSVDLFDSSTNDRNLFHQKESNDASNDEQRQASSVSNDVATRQRERSCRKETKLRSKWTITENLTSKKAHFSKSNARTGNKFRSKNGPSLSAKFDTTEQSLNAEFFRLKSTVMERNHESSKEWLLKDRKQEFFFDGKIPSTCVNTAVVYSIQRPSTSMNYEQTSIFANTVPRNVNSIVYSANNIVPMANVDSKTANNMPSIYENKSNIGAPVYIGKSSTEQLELSAVPRNRMTLLSQIEPNMPGKESEEMTASLSAWFASMRNVSGQTRVTENCSHKHSSHRGETLPTRNVDFAKQFQIDTNRQLQALRNMQSIQSAPWNTENILGKRFHVQQIPEEYDSSEDVRVYMKPGSYNVPKKRHQRRGGKRVDNLRGSGNSHRNLHGARSEKTPRALASSTPVTRTSAYNLTGTITNANSSVVTQNFSIESSPMILKRVVSNKEHLEQDVTWKAACASAEILLEALNVKENERKAIDEEDEDEEYIKIKKESDKEDHNREDNDQIECLGRQRMGQETKASKIREDVARINASSYEASEDDSESTNKLSSPTSVLVTSQETRNGKTNVKTDSWLIRTLNNASMLGKQRRRKGELSAESSESSNSSTMGEERTTCLTSITAVGMATTTITATTTIKDCEKTIDCSDRADEIDRQTRKNIEGTAGRATYSETVRRSTGFATGVSNAMRSDKDSFKKSKPGAISPSLSYTTIIPIPGRKCQRKDTSERSFHLLHKSRKLPSKRTLRSMDTMDDPRSEDGFSCLKIRTTGKETSLVAGIAGKSSQGKKKGDNVNTIVNFVETSKSGNKCNDRGWSVWYSSRRKQSLSPLALSKLEAIHRAIWQMDEAWIFKCPSPSSDRTCDRSSSSVGTMEDYCKVIKSPLFLETVGYKIKNRIYHKIEQAIRDFRRIVYNSRIYHKNDDDYVKKIERLSKKLEDLFEEHFSNWDLGNVIGSPREEGSPVRPKFKSTNSLKILTGRYANLNKSPSRSSSAMENTSLH